MLKKRPFFSDCVGWPKNRMLSLHFLIDEGERISRDAFLACVPASQMRSIERNLGYGGQGGLKMAEDRHVAYYLEPRSNIIFFVHSAIEHVFAEPEEIDALEARLEAADMECPARTIVLYRPGLMTGQASPDEAAADLLEHHLFSVLDQIEPGLRVLVVEGPEAEALSAYDRRQIDRTIAILQEAGYLEGHECFEEDVPDAKSFAPRLGPDTVFYEPPSLAGEDEGPRL